jgi:RNA polymerase sigma-70 factor (ECF subfamily)
MRTPLADVFLAQVRAEARLRFGEPAELDAELGALWSQARAAWPAVELHPALFARYLGERAAEVDRVAAMSATGLYLACACAGGDETAVRSFRDAFARDIAHVLQRMGAATLVDEVTQQILDGLFVGGGQRAAGIVGYRGHGELRAWVRVVAVREAYTLLRRQRKTERREVGGEEADLERALGARDPEIERLKAAYRSKFKQAFEQAFQSLPARDRTLLRYQFLDGLRLEQIGVIYDVSRATAARWLARARDRLLKGTRGHMREDLEVSRGELDSVMNLIESQLEVSISRLLKASRRESSP